MSWDDERVRAHVTRLEGLLGELDQAALPVVQALVELYGEALDRALRVAAEAGVEGALAADELVGHLLVTHGLHPEPPEVRVGRALGAMAEYLARQGTAVEVAGIDGAAVQLLVAAEGRACAAAPVTAAVERAVRAAAPELERVEMRAPEPVPPERPWSGP